MITKVLFVVVSVTLAASAAHAGVVEYEGAAERPLWFNDVGGLENVSTVDFTGYPDLTPADEQWADLGVHFSGFNYISGPGCIIFPNDCWGLTAEPDIIMDFDQPMQWIAADFPGTLNIELFKQDQLIYSSTILGGSGTGHFGGPISDDTFDKARLFRSTSSLVFLDDLHFGPPIPTPGAFAPLAFGLFVPRRPRCLRVTTRSRERQIPLA